MSRFNDKVILKHAAFTDESLGMLLDLLQQGYTTVVWQKNPAACAKCTGMHGMSWPLQAFVNGLLHDAPMFEKSHVNCRCGLTVKHPTMGEQEIFAF